jgi:phosphodiesterase/alkaline phosphatase D-like protein
MTRLILGPMIGGLATNRANLWGRADGPGMLHAWIGKNPDLSDAQLSGKSLPLAGENGFAGVAPIDTLLSNTRYHYALTLSDSPPIPASGAYPSFTTFPASGERQSFTFAFGSCFRPADQNGGQIFTVLNAMCQRENIRFLLMIGDQIYADAYEYNGHANCLHMQEYRRCTLTPGRDRSCVTCWRTCRFIDLG